MTYEDKLAVMAYLLKNSLAGQVAPHTSRSKKPITYELTVPESFALRLVNSHCELLQPIGPATLRGVLKEFEGRAPPFDSFPPGVRTIRGKRQATVDSTDPPRYWLHGWKKANRING